MAKKIKDSHLSLEERLEQALIPNWDEPYKLPDNWCWVRVDAISSIYTGNSINERIKEEKYTGQATGLVYLSTKDIGFNATIDYETNVRIPQTEGFKIAPKYSTLLCVEGGSAGRKIGFVIQDVCFVNKLCAFVPKDNINPKYLYYVIQSFVFKSQFDAKKHGLIGGVSVKEVSSIYVPIAPFEHQNRIVERIESLFAKLDEAKEKAQKVIDGFEACKAAILHKAFSGELTAKWREENRRSYDWRIVQAQEVCEKIVCGKTPTEYIGKIGDIPYLKVYNIVGNEIDFEHTPQFIPRKIHYGKLKSSILKPNDVIMNIVGPPLRKIAIIPGTYPEWNMNQAIVRFRPKEEILPRFLYYSLINPKTLADAIAATKGVVGQANISVTQSRELLIKLPALLEQEEIIRILDSALAKAQRSKEAAEGVIEQIDIMKKAILARAFCGELGTNDPTEECAVDLLKKIISTSTE